MTNVHLIVWLLTIGVAVFLALYVTYLFVHRLRHREPPFKTFLAWLRDLFDIASGLG
jgi:hypothetical protein